MAMYPTPTTQEIEHPDMILNEKGRRMPKKGKTDHSLNLADTVRMMYPTPTPACEEGGQQSHRVERTKSGGFVLRKKNKTNQTYGAKLSDAMLYLENKKIYNTPTTNDHKNTSFPKSQKNRHSIVGNLMQEKNPPKVGGRLNPQFVQFLMGYPMNWTKIE